MKFSDVLKSLAAICLVMLCCACSGGTFSRGQFQGYVVGHSEDEIVAKIGKPVEVVDDQNRPRWIYGKKTFDTENFNKVDEKATVILERKEGRLVGVDVIFG